MLSTDPLVVAINPTPANVTDRSIVTANEVDSYSFTIRDALGGGVLNVALAATSVALAPRLTLARTDETVLIQSDSGHIGQHLKPGTYLLSVSAQSGQGDYRLSTQFTPTQDPFQPPGTGKRPTLAVADVNGDGSDDLITANYNDDSVSVLLGAGDGSFQAFTNFAVDSWPLRISMATALPTSSRATTSAVARSACCWEMATAPFGRHRISRRGTVPSSR